MSDFAKGWRYFWNVTDRPFVFVTGFVVASGVCNFVGLTLMLILRWVLS